MFAGACQSTTMLILPVYFDKKRGLATCLNAASVGISQMVMPQIIRILQENMGSFGSTIIYSGIILNSCVAAALFRPLPQMKENRESSLARRRNSGNLDVNALQKEEIKEFIFVASQQSLSVIPNSEISTKLTIKDNNSHIYKEIFSDIFQNIICCIYSLRSFKVLICGFGFSQFLIGYINFVMMIPFIVMEAGHSYETASYCMTSIAISNTTIRFLMAMLSDKSWFNIRAGFVSGSIISATFCVRKYRCLYIIDLLYTLYCIKST